MNNQSKQSKPIILIVPDYKNGGENQYSSLPHYAIRCNYFDPIITAETLPLVIPYDQNSIKEYLNIASGLVFIGGGFDLHPSRYQQEMHPKIKLNQIRDDFEYQLISQAISTEIPILGICNGMQLLNVICGGSLIAHIPDHQQYLDHEQSNNPDFKNYHQGYHQISFDQNSKLAEIIKEKSTIVNSSHHQAIKNIGNNLRVIAKSRDGIVEAIESTTDRFLLGVQWHPEFNSSTIDKEVFRYFVREVKKYQNNRQD